MRSRTWRHELVGERSTPTTPDAAEPATQNQCSPAMKNSAAQTSEISIVWPKSGCRISGTMVSGSSSSAMRLPGTSRRLRAFREGPGGEDHEGGLDEFGRLDAEDPAARALHLVAEQQRERRSAPCREDDDRQAGGRRAASGTRRRDQHERSARGTSPGGRRSRRSAGRALRHRRAARHGEDDAGTTRRPMAASSQRSTVHHQSARAERSAREIMPGNDSRPRECRSARVGPDPVQEW